MTRRPTRLAADTPRAAREDAVCMGWEFPKTRGTQSLPVEVDRLWYVHDMVLHDEYHCVVRTKRSLHTRPGSGSSHGGNVERKENHSFPSGSPTGKTQVMEKQGPRRGGSVFPARGLEAFCVLI